MPAACCKDILWIIKTRDITYYSSNDSVTTKVIDLLAQLKLKTNEKRNDLIFSKKTTCFRIEGGFLFIVNYSITNIF